MLRPTPILWSEERAARLKELAGDPIARSAAQIAKTLNEEFPLEKVLTRNSVLGRLDRDRIKKNPAPHSAQYNLLNGIRRRDRQRRPRLVTKPLPATDDAAIGLRCRLLELTNETCRYPIGEPDHPNFMFCGFPEADLSEHRPYCAYHAQIAFRGRGSSSGRAGV